MKGNVQMFIIGLVLMMFGIFMEPQYGGLKIAVVLFGAFLAGVVLFEDFINEAKEAAKVEIKDDYNYSKDFEELYKKATLERVDRLIEEIKK